MLPSKSTDPIEDIARQLLSAEKRLEKLEVQEVVAGAGAGAWTQITDSILLADQEFDFAAIAATFNHLRLIGHIRSNTAASVGNVVHMRFNGDGGANYDTQRVRVNQAAVVTSTEETGSANPGILVVPAQASTANYFSPVDISIPSYRRTDTFKMAHIVPEAGLEGAAGTVSMNINTFWWRNTAVISRIQLYIFPQGGAVQFAAGSRLTLYGIT